MLPLVVHQNHTPVKNLPPPTTRCPRPLHPLHKLTDRDGLTDINGGEELGCSRWSFTRINGEEELGCSRWSFTRIEFDFSVTSVELS